ncbi:hypothetical protein LTR56_008967 [Elasticomyces elasticus]|nr:hypothetical protein LTR56_008967 [Elasticomyces elasticus]KAK4924094.1 hypothetical protein LTR49_008834 [Elasticomyces elasticus]KAK5764452.1 hypothetical protein LTS12_005428 [Elasticomyces elasticus]
MTTDVSALQNLLSHLVGQLLHGCGEKSCQEPLCDTGRRNATPDNRPVRKYTPRSARAIALALVGGPSPREHICPHYSLDATTHERREATEGPQDPSSFEQQLCDTSVIRNLCDRTTPMLIELDRLTVIKQSLEPLLIHIKLSDDAPSSFVSNERAITLLCGAVRACLDSLPTVPIPQYTFADKWIRKGSAFPTANVTILTAESRNVWLSILDGFEHGQSLMSCIVEAIAMRTDLEVRLVRVKRYMGMSSKTPPEREFLPRLMERLELPSTAVVQLVVWLKRTFMLHWNGKPSIPRRSAAGGAMVFLQSTTQLARTRGPPLAVGLSRLPAVANNISAVDMAESWIALRVELRKLDEAGWKAVEAGNERQGSPDVLADVDNAPNLHILDSGLIKDHERVLYFRTTNYLKMQRAYSNTANAIELRRQLRAQIGETRGQIKYNEEHYLLLNLSRTNTLRDAYDQLWHRRSAELFRPLRVRLGEVEVMEVGQDLGGVQIEAFNLIWTEALAEENGLFTTDSDTVLSYFRVGSLQPLHHFEMLGVLFGLAVHNGIILPVSFPAVFYKLLLGKESIDGGHLGPADLADGWPGQYGSLIQFSDDPDATDWAEFQFGMEANGVRLYAREPAIYDDTPDEPVNGVRSYAREPAMYDDTSDPVILEVMHASSAETGAEVLVDSLSWPGFKFKEGDRATVVPVVAATKERYLTAYVEWIVVNSVVPQLKAFRHGFYRIIDQHSLSIISSTPETLKSALEGSTRLDVDDLRKCTKYTNYYPNSSYIVDFWDVVKNWPEKKQRQLLQYVTAVERVPLGGCRYLTFEITRAWDPNLLPESSTCFGMLKLPQYDTKEILDEKLTLALEFGLEGFGNA